MTTREWIGLQLRKARQPKKQEEVAADLRAMGIPMTQNRLSRLERGETEMTPKELAAFCRYYEVPPEYFLDRPEEQVDRSQWVNEDQGVYPRLVKKLEGLSKNELEAIERIVDELRKKS